MYVTKIGKKKGKYAKSRNKLWEARDRAGGIKRSFRTEKEANAFRDIYNADNALRSHNLPPTNKVLKDWDGEFLIRVYMKGMRGELPDKIKRRVRPIEADDQYDKEIDKDEKDELVESCELQGNLAQMLLKLSGRKFFQKTLFDITPTAAQKFLDEMRHVTYVSEGSEVEKTYSTDTIRKFRSLLSRVWQWGPKNIPGLEGLKNVWIGAKIPGKGFKRQRGLNRGELENLIQHSKECRGSNRYYVPLAINLAVDTGMRRQDIFDLTWEDVDFENRTILIKWDKNSWRREAAGMDTGRKICLPPLSHMALKLLYASLRQTGRTPCPEGFEVQEDFRPPKGWIFMNADRKAGKKPKPMTGPGFKQAFEKVRDNAKIIDINPKKRLTPHSLRAAAKMKLRRVLGDDDETDFMLNGLKDNYDVEADFLETIKIKLDTDCFGKPFDEIDSEQRHLLTVSYPLQQGMSLEAIAKLGNWLFDDKEFDFHTALTLSAKASAQDPLAEAEA